MPLKVSRLFSRRARLGRVHYNKNVMSENKNKDKEPVWCLVANVVEERHYGPGGNETRRGTKHFAPGAKIYCFPVLWGDGYEKIDVVGRHRGSHRFVRMVISSEWLTNWRAQLVYSLFLIEQFDGIWGEPESVWRWKAKSPEGHVNEYVEMMKEREVKRNKPAT